MNISVQFDSIILIEFHIICLHTVPLNCESNSSMKISQAACVCRCVGWLMVIVAVMHTADIYIYKEAIFTGKSVYAQNTITVLFPVVFVYLAPIFMIDANRRV